MGRYFNTEGCCYPDEHYMVNLDSRLKEIKSMVDAGKYFTINRGRQYGKTTTLCALENSLKEEYDVISMDFQDQMSSAKFENEEFRLVKIEQSFSVPFNNGLHIGHIVVSEVCLILD